VIRHIFDMQLTSVEEQQRVTILLPRVSIQYLTPFEHAFACRSKILSSAHKISVTFPGALFCSLAWNFYSSLVSMFGQSFVLRRACAYLYKAKWNNNNGVKLDLLFCQQVPELNQRPAGEFHSSSSRNHSR